AEVACSTTAASFRADACLRRRMLLGVDGAQGLVRYYDGLPDRVRFVAHRGDELFFEVRLRPALAALEHREGSRIFQDMSPVDVVKAILKDAGVDADVEWRLGQTFEKRAFLCQYRETALNFVERPLEDEGIFYYFLHSPDDHRCIFADDPAAFVTPAGGAKVVLAVHEGAGPGAQPLLGLRRTRTLRATQVALRDYDFEKPDAYPQ